MNAAKTLPLLACVLLIAACASMEQSPTAGVGREGGAPPTPEAVAALPVTGRPTAEQLPARETRRGSQSADFWQRIRADFKLPLEQPEVVTSQIAWYQDNGRFVERVFKRGEPYLPYIQDEVSKRGLPAELVLLPFVESAFDPLAYSPGRAAGLWQFIPSTGRHFDLHQDWWYDGRRDVIASTEAALAYLEQLNREFDGDWLLALAAYNAGGGTVRAAIRKNRKAGRPVDFWHLSLPRETSAYVPKLLALRAIVATPERHGIQLDDIQVTPHFTVVDTGGQLDLAVAADLADIDTEEIYRLNPGLNRWATPPDGPHRLVIGADQAANFREALADLPPEQRVKWVRHKIHSGETLSHIARRYETTVAVLRQANELSSNTIRTGRHLVVPVAAQDSSQYAALNRLKQNHKGRGHKLVYQVKAGDSLWAIARRHKVSTRQLVQWNRLDDGPVIKPGQQLAIWQDSNTPQPDRTTRPVSYTVRKGDSLFRISRKFNVSISDLRLWNKLPDKYLQPGQRLKLYVDVTRQSQSEHG